MSRPIVIEHNATTNEIIEREMTDEELAQWEADGAAFDLQQQTKTQIISAKAALLEKLGITEEEAKLLLS